MSLLPEYVCASRGLQPGLCKPFSLESIKEIRVRLYITKGHKLLADESGKVLLSKTVMTSVTTLAIELFATNPTDQSTEIMYFVTLFADALNSFNL